MRSMIEHPERAELSCVAHTDAGMLAIWDPASFATVVDYDTWEVALLDDKDIIGHVGQGGLVPICIGADGAWGVTLRVGTGDQRADLTEREKQYLIVSSEPYLFVSAGLVCVSGLEAITAEPDEAVSRLAMPIGRFRRHDPSDRLGGRTRREERSRRTNRAGARGLRRTAQPRDRRGTTLSNKDRDVRKISGGRRREAGVTRCEGESGGLIRLRLDARLAARMWVRVSRWAGVQRSTRRVVWDRRGRG
jgi:hypothetical protein